ncbi:Protein K09F5.6 [Aphelenchoides avenae]|nr:Protein K09F5.6 [Aphelenchus avenae]
MYVTDDPLAKQSMLRQAVRNNANEDVYWLRANQSPSTRKVPLNEGKGTPEMTRLLGPSMRRSSNAPGSPVPLAGPPYEQGSSRQSHQRVDRFPSNDGTVNTFGTLKRVSHDTGYGTQSSVPYGPRSPVPNRAHQPADSYASIHKNGNSRLSHSDLVERRSSAQNEYGQMGGTYSNSGTMYATYGRSAPYRSPNYATYNGGPNGGIVGQRQSSEPIGGTGQSSVKASPLLTDRQNVNNSGRVGFREQSPYAPRSAMKLASFNGHGEKIYGQLVNGDQWNGVDDVLAQHQPQQAQSIQQQQRPTVISLNAQKPPPPNQHAPPSGHWNPANNYTKLGTLSASSSGPQDGGSYTPSSSTMTSQGSSSYSTQEHTPAAGSPTGATAGSHPALYDNADVTLTRDAVQSLKNTLNAHAAARNGTNPNGLRPAIKTATISVDAREDVYGDYTKSTNRGPAKFGQINGGGDEFATSVV